MTEEQWLVAMDAVPMLASFSEATSARKLRLFACGCCRRILYLIADSRCQMAVDVAEWYADGQRDDVQRLAANDASYSVYAGMSEPGSGFSDAAVGMRKSNWEAAQAATYTTVTYTGGPCEAVRGAQLVAYHAAEAASLSDFPDHQAGAIGNYLKRVTGLNERAGQADLMRCIFGNPFRPVSFSPSWRSDSAVALASGMYGSRDFSAMLILADALQDAGCDSPEVLEHCRDPKCTHVRGCWVVDLVLGKE